MVDIHQIITYFKHTTEKIIPYSNSQLVSAVKEAASIADRESLEQLADSMASAYVRLNPDESEEIMVRNARDTLATLAYLADHEVDPITWMAVGPVKAYQSARYGPAMTLVKAIFDSQHIDLMRDVFEEIDPNLN